jgi:hypothetical protein
LNLNRRRPPRNAAGRALLLAAVALLATPIAAHAGTAVSTVPNLPDGARAGGSVTVGETGLHGSLIVSQTFNGADFGSTARLDLIRLSPNCGPGPSPGNLSANGPAINTPEAPCTNPDLGVFVSLSLIASGSQACAGTTFATTPPDLQGIVDLIPTVPVYLHNGETCEVGFTFTVLKIPTKDTFPNASGMQTTSVSSVRSTIISDPSNPAAVGLRAAGLGSGSAVLVQRSTSCTDPSPPPSCSPSTPCVPGSATSGSCAATGATKGKKSKLSVAGTCTSNRVRASVSGKQVSSVTYLVDGHVVRKVKKNPFKLNAKVKLSPGSHKLTASVTYTKASGKGPQVLTKRLGRCGDPNFTG